MKFNPLLIALAIASAILFSSCNGILNNVKIAHTNFSNEIEQNQNLVFTFNKNLVSDSLLNSWDTTAYIHFNPAITGKFKWTAKDELTFSPSQPFAPSTDYKATVTPKIISKIKSNFQITTENTISFHTPYLKVTTTQAYWSLSDQQTGGVEVRVNMAFNYPVKSSEVSQLLHLSVKGNDTPFTLNSNETSTSFSVSIAPPDTKKDETTPVKITIEKGLKLPGSDWLSKEAMELTTEIPAKGQLMVMQMTSSFENGEGIIKVQLNQPAVNENIKSLVKIDQKINFTAETIDGGIIIKGDFSQNGNYNITLSKSLKGIFGTTLETDYSQYVSFGTMDPVLDFANEKGIYLTPAGAKNLSMHIAGIEKLKVTIVRIYENNILAFMRSGEDYGYNYGEDDESYHDFRYYDADNYGDKVSEKIISAKSLARTGNSTLLHLDLEDMGYSNSFKGIYVVKLEDVDRQWLQVSKFISYSDIGLIVKQSKNDILVFANSIKSTEPVADAKVKFISTNNQVVASAQTNGIGFAQLENTKAYKPFSIGMITVRSGDDFNFMILNRTAVETSRYDVGGKNTNEANYDCFVYGDRYIYRPGDTIHVNTIVRSLDWNTLKDIPVKIKLISPNGKEYKTVKENLDAQGSAEGSFPLPTFMMTGLYTVEVYSGNDVLLNYSKISVEEFMPDRIKVTTTLNKNEVYAGDSITASITAVNLFGPPAANRNYEATLNLKRQNFTSKKFNDYSFNIHTNADVNFESVVREGKTDAEGKAKEIFPINDYHDLGLLAGNIFTTVFDESGRPVNRLANFTLITQDVFYGIKNMDEWIDTRRDLSVPLIALNKSGVSVSSVAEVQVVRIIWETVIQRSGGSYYYNSQKREQVLLDKNVNIVVGGTVFNYLPINSGDYEVRVKRSGADNYVVQEFWAYGWGDTQNNSFEVSNEGEVNITLNKDKYGIGDAAELLFNSPFDGKILVTVERDKVFSFFYLTTEKKSASLTIPITENYLPNVYVTATAIREMGNNSLPLVVARGFVPLLVEKPSNKISVTVTAPEKSRSKTKQKITVTTIPNAEVTIAVVDEGILQLKNFQTPDPYGYFYAKRSLEVSDYDLYPFVFPEYPYHVSSTGGDMADMSKRVNPITAKRVNLISKWSGVLKTNSSGQASFSIDIPQFSGALRVMAVAYKGKSFGSSEKTIKVSDPIVISTSLPRFITPGDTISIPVTLTNSTLKNASASTTISVTGPLQLVGVTNQSATLNANAEKQLVFKLVAKNEIGVGSVTVSVNGINETFTDKTEIGIRPSSPLQKRNGGGVIAGEKTFSINLSNDFIVSGSKAKLIISRSPLVQFSKNLNYLLQYPYGCVEQTVSTAFPQLYFTDLSKALGQEKNMMRMNPNYNVQEAINKLESMQLYNGALSYWPGESEECWWGSVYAAHFLYEAKHAGFEVNQSMLDKLLGYLQAKIKTFDTENYWYWDNNDKLLSRTIAKKEIIYSMYVLALTGKYDYTAMNYYKSNNNLLSLDCKYLLACTFALAGNNINYLATLPKIYSGEYSVNCFSGSFSSGIRDEALALNSLMEVDPENPQVGMMVKHLSEMMKRKSWLNTQESAFSFLALGKFSRKANQSTATATVSVNGSVIGNFTGSDLVITNGINNKSVTVKTSSGGSLFYFWELEGISAKGTYHAEDKFMEVRKTFLDRYGRPINGNTFAQNDLIVVKITVQSLDYNSDIENVAITDMLPAGFEIENSRVGASPELSWIKDNTDPDYLDIRDDRINFFATVTSKPRNFYYLVRAVSKGKFVMGPVSAYAMYNSEYHSINGSGFVVVK